MIGMTDIIILDTEYTSHNGSKIQKPHNVVVNGETMGHKSIYDLIQYTTKALKRVVIQRARL